MKWYTFILIMSLANCSNSQSKVFIEKIDPPENLSRVIIELSDIQKECDYYASSLMYLVQDVSSVNTPKVSVTMIEGLEFLPKQMFTEIVGYFESENRTVLLMGESAKKLFSNPQGKKEFVYDEDFEVYPSDYSLWIYELKGSELIEIESYKIPCQ